MLSHGLGLSHADDSSELSFKIKDVYFVSEEPSEEKLKEQFRVLKDTRQDVFYVIKKVAEEKSAAVDEWHLRRIKIKNNMGVSEFVPLLPSVQEFLSTLPPECIPEALPQKARADIAQLIHEEFVKYRTPLKKNKLQEMRRDAERYKEQIADNIGAWKDFDLFNQKCEMYQRHLITKITSFAVGLPASIEKSFNGVMSAYQTGTPAEKQAIKLNAPLYLALQKYEIVKDLNKLSSIVDIDNLIDRPKKINSLLNRINDPATQDILVAHADPANKRFLVALAVILTGVLPGLIFLAVKSYNSSRHSIQFWRSHGDMFLQDVQPQRAHLHEELKRSKRIIPY
jgi:hypothetical protein